MVVEGLWSGSSCRDGVVRLVCVAVRTLLQILLSSKEFCRASCQGRNETENVSGARVRAKLERVNDFVVLRTGVSSFRGLRTS